VPPEPIYLPAYEPAKIHRAGRVSEDSMAPPGLSKPPRGGAGLAL